MVVGLISYETNTLDDLSFFLDQEKIEYIIVNPDTILEEEQDQTFEYLNLVIKDFDLRKQINDKMSESGLTRFTYIHPNSVVNKKTISDGSIIYPNTTVYPTARVGNDVLIHSNSRVSHGSKIGQGTFIGGQVNISGSATIGAYCTIYPGVNVIDKISIADNVIIGANSLVRKNVNASGTYSSIPSEFKKL